MEILWRKKVCLSVKKAKILFLYKYLGVVILFFIKMSIMCEQILD